MADIIKKSTNKFTKGLIMDFSPENTQNEVLTHALNATLLTFNGNEMSLQNDMGNGRVETAFLPDGYMPVGTCEYGGIIYIVSYNPLEDKSQIGCFPSPERNISSDELGIEDVKIPKDSFQNFVDAIIEGKTENVPDGSIKNNTKYVLLRNSNLNPGDKFLINSEKTLYDEQLADLWVNDTLKENPIIALNVVSIEESGKITYLNSDIRQYEVKNSYTIKEGDQYKTVTDTYKYHILGEAGSGTGGFNQQAVDIDAYRNVLSSGFSVFKSKTSGKLAILAELIMIDSYSVTHSIIPKKNEEGYSLDGKFDICIYTEVSPNTNDPSKYLYTPKLKYYYLEKSQGYLQLFEGYSEIRKTLFQVDENSNPLKTLNNDFFNTYLNHIYVPTTNSGINLNRSLKDSGQFNFPKSKTYHGSMDQYTGDFENGKLPSKVFTKFTEGVYHRIKKEQIAPAIGENLPDDRDYTLYNDYYIEEANAKFYYYNKEGNSYEEFTGGELDESVDYFIKKKKFIYHDAERNTANKDKTLYTMSSLVQEASSDVVENPNIEKFQYETKDIYSLANMSDPKLNTSKLWYQSVENNKIIYKNLIGAPDPNVTYYLLETQKILKSVGFTPGKDIVGSMFYYPGEKEYDMASKEQLEMYWDFNTYPDLCPITLYWREDKDDYIPATTNEILNWEKLGITLYYNSFYNPISVSEFKVYEDTSTQLFVLFPMDTYIPASKFQPDKFDNWIDGYELENPRQPAIGIDQPTENGKYVPYPKEKPLALYTVADFIPSNQEGDNYLKYADLRLGNIKIPYVLTANSLDLPFKYDYTIVPCMNYGRLDHLKISNTVDFSKLHAFNQSDFTTWKYHIDGNQLRLTFGADIFDTYETDKVDGLILEFYDLWGFAGSIEIFDKKAYSGVYTKIIPLNGLNGIGRKKVVDNHYSTNYKRNISITPYDSSYKTFKYKDSDVAYQGYEYGWSVNDEDNDCGTLYSNILYGVKTYIRRTKNKGTSSEEVEFIRKKDFFLYTIPIYNDYYYSIQDFSSLINPKLDLMLTYKLQNSGNIEPYSQSGSNAITNGFNKDDQDSINQYLSGSYSGSSLKAIKYYNYSGISNLSLEIGLKKEYENFGLSFKKEINNLFSCTLQLVGDEEENKNFSIYSSDTTMVLPEQILNYYNQDTQCISKDVNYLVFEQSQDEQKNKIQISKNDFSKYNFINNPERSYITISYNFIAGYQAHIRNIRPTEIPATTVCALFHQNDSGEYNYEDFGVHKAVGTSGEDLYLSKTMFFNSGTSSTEKVGICSQVATTGNASDQLSIGDTKTPSAADITKEGVLNSGSSLKELSQHIGKLTFCQPHCHAIDTSNGVNVHGNDSHPWHVIPPESGGDFLHENAFGGAKRYDNTYGIVPFSRMYYHPRYNLCLNTVNSIKFYDEFISTMHYDTSSDKSMYILAVNSGWNKWKAVNPMRNFVGMTGAQLSTYNQKLLKTMSGVYGYNPDYDTFSVCVGDASVQDYYPYFTSNLVCVDSKVDLDEDNFNNYIYIGSVLFSDYLQLLETYSKDSSDNVFKTKDIEGKPLGQVQLQPNLKYCGSESNPVLISSLTYNTPVPENLASELEFSAGNSVIVKHSNTDDGVSYVMGKINKKALYAYVASSNKLVQLDVSNYTIAYDGSISIRESEINTSGNSDVINCKTTYNYSRISNHQYVVDYSNTCFRGTSITINDLLYEPNEDHKLYMRNGLVQYDSYLRNKLYYRTLSTDTSAEGGSANYGAVAHHTSWHYNNTKNKNTLFLYTGPCFVPSNL